MASKANINESYTTLNEVFNDTTTLQALTTNNASCEYLLNSTEWINDVTSNENAMTYIGNDDYCGDTLVEDSSWLLSIQSSAYWDKVLEPLVPIMTSNTAPYGEAICSSKYNGGYDAWYAFDTNESAGWNSAVTNPPHWLGYHFTKKMNVKMFRIKPIGGQYNPKNIIIQGSNDRFVSEIDDLGSFMIPDTTKNEFIKPLSNNTEYEYYRVYIVDGYGSPNGLYIATLQFYGRN